MAKKGKEFKCDIINNFGEIDTDGRYSLSLIEVSWQNRESVLDIRRIDNETGKMSKGVSFFHKEGLENLVYLAIEEGLCDPAKVNDILSNRGEKVEKLWYERNTSNTPGRRYSPFLKVVKDDDLLYNEED